MAKKITSISRPEKIFSFGKAKPSVPYRRSARTALKEYIPFRDVKRTA